MAPEALTIELSGSSDHGPCECCGNCSRTVWGFVNACTRTAAVYYVHWTVSRVHDHGAHFELVLGNWGQDSSPEQRRIIAVAFRLINGEPQFMVIDAAGPPVAARGKLASRALRRDEVVGTPLAAEVFAMLDAIWAGDSRIRELSGDVA